MRHFTSVHDVTDLQALLQEAVEIKREPFRYETLGRHRTMGLLFFNSSLRTRLSTQKAAQNLGMNTMALNVNEDSWKIETEFGVVMNGDKAEHIKEAAAVIGRYCDIIGIRSFPSLKDRAEDYSESVINQFIRYAGVPVVSMESATRHPLQSFADIVTIEQYKKTPRPKVLLAWAPHCRALPQSVPNSFAEWAVAAGYEVVVTHPEGYELDPSFTKGAVIEYDREKAYKDADFVYAKNWSSYTQYGKILNNDLAWTCNAKNMALTRHAKFMHCLPVRRNLVVSDEVIDGPDSIVIEEAANRVVSAQTVLCEILKTGLKTAS
ncbi:MAG: N-acetylornithine carbamoyltransferase [Bacteroidales bacterium]|jgi:N-succinyl-L-ornithine transcarbamylase|nr:N-acetylornithine carbamoyltransferase [Bacteroidales bacterium]